MTRQGGQANERMNQRVVRVALAFGRSACLGYDWHDSGQGLAVFATTADSGKLPLYVLIEVLHLSLCLLNGKDHIGPARRERFAAPRRPGLDNHRASLRRGRDIQGTARAKPTAFMLNIVHPAGI